MVSRTRLGGIPPLWGEKKGIGGEIHAIKFWGKEDRPGTSTSKHLNPGGI